MSVQFTDPIWNGTPWFWDYKVSSDVPPPNNATYPPVIYSSYDPNWAYFVGAQFVQIISEFENLLPADLVEEMVQSMYMAARNLMTRVGYNGDNLVTAYTNPALGRALLVKWVGHRIGDHNLTHAGRQYAQDIYDLFTADGYNTFGEYNAPSKSRLPANDQLLIRFSVLRRGCSHALSMDPARASKLKSSWSRQVHATKALGRYRVTLQLVRKSIRDVQSC